jgi:hypothetical protein
MTYIERFNPVRRSVVRQSVVRRSRYDPGPRFAIGLDLGQARFYPLSAVLKSKILLTLGAKRSQSMHSRLGTRSCCWTSSNVGA